MTEKEQRHQQQQQHGGETQQQEVLPVLIVGAGPCGLTAAATLMQRQIPFKIIEKVTRDKICSNAGAGFELASTAIQIYKERLGLSVPMSFYVGMNIMAMKARGVDNGNNNNNNGNGSIRDSKFDGEARLASVNRAELQNYLIEKVLFPNGESDEKGVLLCGSGFASYEEKPDEADPANSRVTVTLQSGETIDGSVLLACDGINSAIRSEMHGGEKIDPLLYSGTIYYWGKTPVEPGSDLEKEFVKTQTYREEGPSVLLGTSRKGRCGFFVVPTKNDTVLVWAFMKGSKDPPRDPKGDSTRRGGGVLSEEEKKRLFFSFGGVGGKDNDDDERISSIVENFPLLKKMIELTPEITEAGLFDRKNLDLPFSSEKKLVALLGDSAHPQTPALGQGVNMAITDAYVYATRIAGAIQQSARTTATGSSNNSSATTTRTVQDAIASCDTVRRRKQAGSIVKEARVMQDSLNSSNRLFCWLMKLFLKFAPMSLVGSQIDRFDKSNREYLFNLDKEEAASPARC